MKNCLRPPCHLKQPRFSRQLRQRLTLLPTALLIVFLSSTLLALPWVNAADPAVLAQELTQDDNTYTVAPGDSLSALAERFGVTLEALQQANGIADPNLLEVGQVLTIPESSSTGAALPGTIDTRPLVRALPGDTLVRIAVRAGVEAATLAEINELDATNRLFPGQPVYLPPDQADRAAGNLRFGAVLWASVPETLRQGQTGRITVETRRPLELRATWNGLPISFTQPGVNPLRQTAMIPVPALIATGRYNLVVAYTAANGRELTHTWRISVVDGGYDSQVINLPPDRGALLEPEIVQAEAEKVVAVWSEISPDLYWNEPFLRPVSAEYPTTSPFGTRRSYNAGPFTDYHAGQDFGVPTGVPVVVPGDGIVALAEPLTVRGNAVIIDHGRGIFTGYWHLHELYVETGAPVAAGDILGTVGNTGLSTGAHLHWELRIYGIAVDPMQFLEEAFLSGR